MTEIMCLVPEREVHSEGVQNFKPSFFNEPLGSSIKIISCAMYVEPCCHLIPILSVPTKSRSEVEPWTLMAGTIMVVPSGEEFR